MQELGRGSIHHTVHGAKEGRPSLIVEYYNDASRRKDLGVFQGLASTQVNRSPSRTQAWVIIGHGSFVLVYHIYVHVVNYSNVSPEITCNSPQFYAEYRYGHSSHICMHILSHKLMFCSLYK